MTTDLKIKLMCFKMSRTCGMATSQSEYWEDVLNGILLLILRVGDVEIK